MTGEPSSHSPTDSAEPLDRTAKLEAFARLADDGAFPDGALDRASGLIADSSWASRWLSRALLIYGVTLAAVGVIFFFGFNWDKVPDLAKLGIIQVGFAGALAAGTLRDLHSVTSRILLVVAGVLVGVFLAVFGQVYQTSADAWEFFAIWAALLLPLALLAGTQGAWVLWGVVASTAGVTALEQGWLDDRTLRHFTEMMWIFGMSGLVLITTEWLRRRGAGLVEDYPWSRPLLLVTGFGALTLQICTHGSASSQTLLLVASLVVMIAANVFAIRYYLERTSDIVALSIVGLSWLAISLRYLGEWTFDIVEDGLASFLIMAILTLALTGGLVTVLRQVHQRLGGQGEEAS